MTNQENLNIKDILAGYKIRPQNKGSGVFSVLDIDEEKKEIILKLNKFKVR